MTFKATYATSNNLQQYKYVTVDQTILIFRKEHIPYVLVAAAYLVCYLLCFWLYILFENFGPYFCLGGRSNAALNINFC